MTLPLSIEPHGFIPLSLQFSAGTNPGKKSSLITARTSLGAVTAAVTADVVGTWSLTPSRLDFGRVTSRVEASSREQIIYFESDSDELVGIDTSGTPWISVTSVPIDARRYELTVALRGELLPPGVSVGSIIVRTTSDTKPEAVVHVRAQFVEG